MAGWPQRMCLIQRPVVENHFMDRAGRDEDKPRHACLKGGLEQLQRAGEVRANEDVRSAVMAAAPRARAFPLYGCMDHRVGSLDELPNRLLFSQRTGEPGDGVGVFLEATPVAAGAIPAAELMPGLGKVAHQVAAEKACCTRDGDPHGELLSLILWHLHGLGQSNPVSLSSSIFFSIGLLAKFSSPYKRLAPCSLYQPVVESKSASRLRSLGSSLVEISLRSCG